MFVPRVILPTGIPAHRTMQFSCRAPRTSCNLFSGALWQHATGRWESEIRVFTVFCGNLEFAAFAQLPIRLSTCGSVQRLRMADTRPNTLRRHPPIPARKCPSSRRCQSVAQATQATGHRHGPGRRQGRPARFLCVSAQPEDRYRLFRNQDAFRHRGLTFEGMEGGLPKMSSNCNRVASSSPASIGTKRFNIS